MVGPPTPTTPSREHQRQAPTIATTKTHPEKQLLDMPAASEERDENGLPIKPAVPAILEAVLEETPDVVKVRAALKEDPGCASVADSRGRTVLSHAAARGSAEIVSALLEANAEDASPSAWSAAQYAGFNGHADVLRALLKAGGAPADSCAPAGTSAMPPLMCADRKSVV